MNMDKFRLLLLLLLLISTSTFSQENKNVFYNIESINRAQVDDSVIIGKGTASAILEDGSFYIVDNDNYVIRHFDSDGQLIRAFGNEGRGPGEFLDVSDIYISDGKLFLLDYKNARIQLFTLAGEFIRTIIMKSSLYSNNELIVNNKEIYVLGSMVNTNNSFVHRFNLKGDYLGSFGNFIDFSNFFMNTNGKLQLTQLHAAIHGEKVLYTITAPYRMFLYNGKKELLWQNVDPVLPKPWEGYIEVTPTSYSAKFYPGTFNSVILNNEHFVIYWLDPTKEKCYLDLRKLENGKLVQRSEFDFKMAPIALAVDKNDRLLLLAKNRDNFNLFLYKLAIKPTVN